MAASLPGPKSILKKTRPKTEDDRRAIAVQHAQILQHRKDLEAQILDDLILLSEYPRSSETTSDAPAASDITDFKTHVRLFQPSDYDDLIEERNVNGLCGYVLCPKARRRTGPGVGEWTLAASGQIVKRKDMEKWCSQKCARRALYVKVQLNETAAWERAGIPEISIELLDEGSLPTTAAAPETEEEAAARKMSELTLEDQRQAVRDSAALALERGELPVTATPNGPARKRPVKVTLKENTDIETPSTGVFEDDDHLMVEGYKSTRGTE